MKQQLVKTNVEGFMRDKSSGALINTNIVAYKLYKQIQKENKLDQEVTQLKEEISELKKLLQKLVPKE